MSTPTLTPPTTLDTKAIRTLARSVHKEMRGAGYSSAQVVDFASSILELVREQYRDEHDEAPRELVAE